VDPVSGTCGTTCGTGYYATGNPKACVAIPTCPEGQRWDPVSGTCGTTCGTGYYTTAKSE